MRFYGRNSRDDRPSGERLPCSEPWSPMSICQGERASEDIEEEIYQRHERVGARRAISHSSHHVSPSEVTSYSGHRRRGRLSCRAGNPTCNSSIYITNSRASSSGRNMAGSGSAACAAQPKEPTICVACQLSYQAPRPSRNPAYEMRNEALRQLILIRSVSSAP